jgi:hypothetical protein
VSTQSHLDLLPVHISAGAIDDAVPRADLFVSPDHAMLIDDLLIPARYLVNGVSIRQVPFMQQVRYFHVELETHDILLAEGAPAESYLDTGNRAAFANGPARLATHPGPARDWSEACAELVVTGPRLVAIKRRLFARGARPVPIRQVLQVIDEQRRPLRPTRQTEDWTYTVPPDTRSLHLLSDPFVPARHVAESLDQRRLGVRLSAVSIDGYPMPLDAPIYHDGFYPTEVTGEGACRWTNGAARLVLPEGACEVVLHLVDPVIGPPGT